MAGNRESMRVPGPLFDAVKAKTCVLYAGAGFSLEATSEDGATLPTSAELGLLLAQELHREGHLGEKPDRRRVYDFASLAEDFQTAFGRQKLILLLLEIFGGGAAPGRAHDLAVRLFPTIITTNFDLLFEHAAYLAGAPPGVIVRDSQLPFATASRGPTIFKINGDVNNAEQIVVTAEDYQRHPLSVGIREKLATLLTERTLLFIGCGMMDADLREVYFTVLDRLGDLKPRAYLSTPFPAAGSPARKQWELFRKRWEQWGVEFIDARAGEFLDALDEGLAQTERPGPPARRARRARSPVARFDELLARYRDTLKEQVSTVRLFGLEEPRELEKVFVELTIVEDYRQPRHQGEFLGTMDARMRRQRAIFSDEEPAASKGETGGPDKTKRSVRPDELLSRRTRAVITGAPGCGKTTLLRYLAFQTLKDEKRLPVFLELKTLQKDDIQNARDLGRLLFEKAIAAGLHIDAADREELGQLFLARLAEGKAAVFLDGLDEVSDEASDDLCKAVNEFVRLAHRDNILIISMRPYALKSQFHGVEQMEIASLNARQVEQFVGHYYGADPKSAGFLNELRRRREISEMAGAPILLGVMISLHRERGEILDDRLELYQTIVHDLAVRLDDEKGVRRVRQFYLLDPGGLLKLDFLKELACERLLIDQVRREGEAGEAARLIFSSELIVEKAKQFLTRSSRLEIDPHLLAADALKTPLLREVGADHYAFTHLTIQEYLAAAALARRPDRDEVFCRAYFNTTIVEMEVLPMTLGLVEDAKALYTTIAGLPESLSFAGLRLRGRGLGYGARPASDDLASLAERLAEFIAGSKVDEASYASVVVRASLERRGFSPTSCSNARLRC